MGSLCQKNVKIEDATIAYKRFKEKFTEPSSAFFFLYQAGDRCPHLYSSETSILDDAIEPLLELLVIADLADLLIECRDTNNNEQSLIEWDRALTNYINLISSKCESLWEQEKASGEVPLDWPSFVNIAHRTHLSFDLKFKRSNELLLRLKPKGVAGQVVDYFLIRPELLILVEKAGFCIISFEGSESEIDTAELKSSIEPIKQAISNTLKRLKHERLNSCKVRQLTMSKQLSPSKHQDDVDAQTAVDYLRGLMRSWAERRIITPVLPINVPHGVVNKLKAQLMVWAGFTPKNGNWVYSDDNWNAFTPLMARIWGNPAKCYNLPSLRRRNYEDRTLGEPAWNSNELLLQQAFASTYFFFGSVESSLLLFAGLDRWLSSCRLTIGESDVKNMKRLNDWQEEADSVRDTAVSLYWSQSKGHQLDTADLVTAKSREFAKFERQAESLVEKVAIVSNWSIKSEFSDILTQAAQATERCLMGFNQGNCSLPSSEILRELLNRFLSDVKTTKVLALLSIGSLIWQLDLRIANCAEGNEELVDKVTESITTSFPSEELHYLSSLLFKRRWIKNLECPENIKNVCIYLGVMRRLRHFGLDVSRLLPLKTDSASSKVLKEQAESGPKSLGLKPDPLEKDSPVSTTPLLETVQKLTAKLGISHSLVDSHRLPAIMKVIETIISHIEESELQSRADFREDLFNVRQALKRVAKTSENGDIPLLMRRLEPLIGEEFFKQKLDENIKILEQQMARITELAKLRQQLNEL